MRQEGPIMKIILLRRCDKYRRFSSLVRRLSGLDELQMAGLYLEDLCIHDMTRDIVLAEWQHGANLEVSYREVGRTWLSALIYVQA